MTLYLSCQPIPLQICVLTLRQDDPRKCTAAKLVRFGLARDIKKSPARSIVLDPFSPVCLLASDGQRAGSLVAIDCSWRLADGVFSHRIDGVRRRLPPLLAGNPVNYSKLNKLTTVEALSGALFVVGFKDDATKLLEKFKWGHTFYELNRGLLEDYSRARTQDDIKEIALAYALPIDDTTTTTTT